MGDGKRGQKNGRPISGWLVFDKRPGMSSAKAVAKIKGLFHAEKAGHAGTLDPLASGVLPIALGKATKTVPYIINSTKIYRFTVAWGEERSTDDLEGKVTRMSPKRPSCAEILMILPHYTGMIMQIPPRFSAIKIAGKRAYDLARNGENVEIPARQVNIKRFDLIDILDDTHVLFEVECGKGTYVRSLARDMGRALGCFGHIADLRRIKVASFTCSNSVALEELEVALSSLLDLSEKTKNKDTLSMIRDFSTLDAFLINIDAALDHIPQVALTDEQAHHIRMGNATVLCGRDAPVEVDEVRAMLKGKLLAIGFIEQGRFQPQKVFNGA